MEVVVQITAPHFCAGIVARDGKCIEAAPILRYMIGWNGKQVAAYCMRKRWSWRVAHLKANLYRLHQELVDPEDRN